MEIRHRFVTTVAVCTAVSIFALTLRAAPTADPIVLGVKGKSNATPWVAAAGAFVAVAWGASSEDKTDVFVAVSRDGGRTFGEAVQVNTIAGEARLGGELPPRVTLQPRAGSGEPSIAVLWTAKGETTQIKVARSSDGGRTFAPPVALQTSSAPGDRGWPALTFDSHGTAHAIWLDHRGLAANRTEASRHASHQSGAAHDGVAMAQKSGLYYAAVDGPSIGERELTKGVCYCCKTTLAAGPDGGLYAAWRHVYEGNIRDIAFSASRDQGRTFSAPIRISQDEWELNGCPDDGPAMAVDATGMVHVIWPTVMQGETPEGALFYSTTRDGRAFTPRVRVPTLGSPKPSHPQIAIDKTGRVLVAWDEVINGRRVATARELRRSSDQRIAFAEPVTLAPQSSSMYPVLAGTDGGFVAVWAGGAGEPPVIGVRRIEIR